MNLRLLIGFLGIVLISCSGKPQRGSFYTYRSYSLGTSIVVEYDNNAGSLNEEMEKMIRKWDRIASPSQSNSELNHINRNDSTGTMSDEFRKLFQQASRFYDETKGALDPTMGPVESWWGKDILKFQNALKVDSAVIDSLRNISGFDKIRIQSDKLIRNNDAIQLDFKNIIAGMLTQSIIDLFKKYSVQNYRIAIDDMVFASGFDQRSKPWEYGIDEPTDNPKSRQLLAILPMDGIALAEAGSYREYYTIGEVRYPFVISPKTRRPGTNNLLYVVVVAQDPIEAQAYANAFMIMGAEPAKLFLRTHPKIEAYMVSANYKGEWTMYMSDGLKARVKFVKEDPTR